MPKSIIEAVKDGWKSLTNAEKTNTDNRKLLTYEPIAGTPFYVTGSSEQGYILTVGKYRVTEPVDTIEEAISKLDTEIWLIISRLVSSYIHFDRCEPITNNLVENSTTK